MARALRSNLYQPEPNNFTKSKGAGVIVAMFPLIFYCGCNSVAVSKVQTVAERHCCWTSQHLKTEQKDFCYKFFTFVHLANKNVIVGALN